MTLGREGNRNVQNLPSFGRGFDPHRPYQPNRLKKHVLAQVHFPVYLCTLPFSRSAADTKPPDKV